MNSRTTQIGFSQRICLEWLERTANLVLAGRDEASINEALQELLHDKLSVGGTAKRGSREKAISILMKIWVRAPKHLRSLQRDGLELLSSLPRENHVAVHWGMAMAVYPFWGAVAAHTGRLLRLQGYVTHAEVKKRVQEQYGERLSVTAATAKALRSMVDWQVLQDVSETGKKRANGVYTQGISQVIDDERLTVWMAEAFLHTSSSGAGDLGTVLNSTSLFPFRLSPISADRFAAISGRLDVLRLGLDQDLLMLRKHPASDFCDYEEHSCSNHR